MEDKLFAFPKKSHADLASSGVGREDMFRVAMTLFIMGNLLAFIILKPILRIAGVSTGIFWLILLILNGLIVTMVFRYFVMDEASKKAETEEESSENFNRYCRVRGMSPIKEIEVEGRVIPIYQYITGGVFTIFKFTYGSNTDSQSVGNAMFITELMKVAGTNNISVSSYTMNESFSDSAEARADLKELASCEDDVLRNIMSKITKGVFDVSKEKSNVECLYLIPSVKSEAGIQSLTMWINKLLELMENGYHSFRNLEFQEELFLKLSKEFHSLEGIDTGRIRIENFLADEENRIAFQANELKILTIEYSDGTIIYDEKLIPSLVKRIKRVN